MNARLASGLFISLAFLPISSAVQAADNIKGSLRPFVTQIVQASALTSSYVPIAKERLDPKSDAYLDAEKKYAQVYAKYSAWIADLKTAVIEGKSKKLDEDAQFQKEGTEAGLAAQDFVKFVDEKTIQSKAVTTILTSLADSALKIWLGIKDSRQKDRQNLVAYLEKEATLKSWSELTNPPPKADPKQDAKPSGDKSMKAKSK